MTNLKEGFFLGWFPLTIIPGWSRREVIIFPPMAFSASLAFFTRPKTAKIRKKVKVECLLSHLKSWKARIIISNNIQSFNVAMDAMAYFGPWFPFFNCGFSTVNGLRTIPNCTNTSKHGWKYIRWQYIDWWLNRQPAIPAIVPTVAAYLCSKDPPSTAQRCSKCGSEWIRSTNIPGFRENVSQTSHKNWWKMVKHVGLMVI